MEPTRERHPDGPGKPRAAERRAAEERGERIRRQFRLSRFLVAVREAFARHR